MSVIASIALFALGAILYFATGLDALGVGLMIVGALAALLSGLVLVFSNRRGRRPPAQPM